MSKNIPYTKDNNLLEVIKMKRSISFIVALALMLTAFSVFTVSAAETEWSQDASLMNANGETDVTYKLTSDIAGTLRLQGQNISIDLAGHKWEHSGSVIILEYGSIRVYDSVGGGKINVTGNDAINMGNGTAEFENITITAGADSMDAFFVDGGSLTLKNCTIAGNKAAINAANGSEAAEASARAVVYVENCVFASSTATDSQGRNCAIEMRNNADEITLAGNNVFTNNKIISRSPAKPISECITLADGCTATYTDLPDFVDYKVATIEYTGTGNGSGATTPDTDTDTDNTPSVEEVETVIDIATLPTCGGFTAAGYPAETMLLNFESGGDNSGGSHSIGTINLADYDKLVITYGTDPTIAAVGTLVLKGASDITSVVLNPAVGGWQDTATATFDISNATNNEELFLAAAELANGFVINGIKLVKVNEIEGGTTDTPSTDTPATDAPATDAPATDVPSTDKPSTDKPADKPVLSQTTVIDMNKLPTSGNFTPAGYPADQKVLNFFTGGENDSARHSIGTINLSGYNTIEISYGTDASAATVGTMTLVNAAGNVIASAVVPPCTTGWRDTTTFTLDVSKANNNEELFLNIVDATNGMVVTEIKLIGTAGGSSNGAQNDTGDVMSFAIVIAAAALVVTVLAKKRVR